MNISVTLNININASAFDFSGADKLFEKFALYCTRASMNLSKERGSFKDFENSQYKKGIILGKNKTWFNKNSKLNQAFPQKMNGFGY